MALDMYMRIRAHVRATDFYVMRNYLLSYACVYRVKKEG